MEQVTGLARGVLLTALFSLAGCSGAIDGAAGPDRPGGSGGTGVSQNGAPGGTASGSAASASAAPTDPGAVTMRRLNQTEYNNTVRDLLGTQLKPAEQFPADDLGAGFDTVGSALSLSPAYVMAYEKAAYTLVDDLFANATRRDRLVSCNVDSGGDACARQILTSFARKAFRRPARSDEVDALMLPVTTARQLGASASDGLKHALAAVLLSPLFLFKSEVDEAPAGAASRRLGPHQIATRLSYALWSTMPDDALSAAADAGELTSDAQIGAQIGRMLADPRADALLDTFAAEWLGYRDLDAHEVERSVFPRFTPALAGSMQLEARRFVQEFLHGEAPVEDMLTARFAFVDTALATHYGLPAPPRAASGALTRVDTSSVQRSGLLTLGAFLTATSFSARTSPVKRGDFVLSNLLCHTVPPPPPDIPTLPANMDSLTLRERLEQHRANPNCATCHELMDPIGFGLENYDAIGAYRTRDGSSDVDATGALPDGSAFNGALELSQKLAADPRFPRCVTKKFMTFAIGRLLDQPMDDAWVDQLTARAQADNGSVTSIIRAVLLSEPFLNRRPKS